MTRVLILCAALALVSPARAENAGDAAFTGKDYAQAVALWRADAEKGDAYSQFRLGIMYDVGMGVTKDEARSLAWLSKASEQGFDRAQVRMGRQLLMRGKQAEATPYFQKAADRGNSWGEQGLAMAYYQGQGVPKDEQKAREWFQKAAAQGNPEAEKALTELYHAGAGGLAKDDAQAAALLDQAAAHVEPAPVAAPAAAAPANPPLSRRSKLAALLLTAGTAGFIIAVRLQARQPSDRSQ
jgi:TPR repeat protein